MLMLWTALGLAVADEGFNGRLKQIRDKKGEEKATLKRLMSTLRQYGIPFSCYEVAEFMRIISSPMVLDLMSEIHDEIWVPEDPCPWDCSVEVLRLEYQHPYLVFDRKLGRNVYGTVNPLDSTPKNNERFDGVAGTRAARIPEDERRFLKADTHPAKGALKTSKKAGKKKPTKKL